MTDDTGAFVEGVVDTYEWVAAIHNGARITKHDTRVELTRYDDVVAVTKRRDVHSIDPDTAAIVAIALGAGRPLIPLMLDGEQHTRYRKLLDPLFAPKKMALLEPQIRGLADRLIDNFIGAGHAELHDDLCVPLPSTIFLTLFGMPLEDSVFLNAKKNRILKNEGEGPGFSPKAAYIFRKQLEEADAIVINRIDEMSEKELAELTALVERRRFGLVPRLQLPAWAATLASCVLLDYTLYLWHVLTHRLPLLWRFHRVHHADLDFDVTTGTRFHPIEILLSMLVKAAAILFIGAPALAVFLFEIILNASSMFNHSNIRIPTWADRVVRWMLVTPDMHRVHHSIEASECNSNFGFSLPWWDRLFGTYRAQPAAGHERMIIGIKQFRSRRNLWVDQMLLQPFREQTGGYPINRQPEAR